MSLYLAIGFIIGITLLIFGLIRKKKVLIISSSIILAMLVIGIVLLANALGTM